MSLSLSSVEDICFVAVILYSIPNQTIKQNTDLYIISSKNWRDLSLGTKSGYNHYLTAAMTYLIHQSLSTFP